MVSGAAIDHTANLPVVPSHLAHESFEQPGAEDLYDPEFLENAEYASSHMPDDVTREYAYYMHYAAYRMSKSTDSQSRSQWYKKYLVWRDQIVLGNRKLVYRAVRKWMPNPTRVEDMTSDCQIVFIQSVAAYNPWIGIRFSTYVFTCLMRALSRISQRQSKDRLTNSIPLETMGDVDIREEPAKEMPGTHLSRIQEYLSEDHDLLSMREKLVIKRRFLLPETEKSETLEKVGEQLGLSKERVRQLQTTALDKLRKVLSA